MIYIIYLINSPEKRTEVIPVLFCCVSEATSVALVFLSPGAADQRPPGSRISCVLSAGWLRSYRLAERCKIHRHIFWSWPLSRHAHWLWCRPCLRPCILTYNHPWIVYHIYAYFAVVTKRALCSLCFNCKSNLLSVPSLQRHYCFHQYYGRIRLLDGLRSYSSLHWPILPTVSCTEPSRSPRYVKYSNIRYAVL